VEQKQEPQTTPKVSRPRSGGPTKQQQQRGRRGEEEIRRRLELPGGWAGFAFREDRREDGCGYDFLCERHGRQVQVEVKTFTRNGYIVVTSSELRAAASSRDDYYIIGILADEDQPQDRWETFRIQDPIGILLTGGQVRIQAELRAPAAQVFGFAKGEE
jgi:hypothetical protein